ncbi:MAG: ATP-grasp domain-containing protein [Proteobacteria bacterium]|nr:ATP-grasp domain-containing protein [Pseudomonadota bacterium]
MGLLAVAAISARLLAEAAARDGYAVAALDVFGDVDTCRAASRWFAIGTPQGLRIDPDRVLETLTLLARRGDAIGWIAGGGLEAWPGMLAAGARLLPLFGTAPEAVRRVRDPACFFDALARLDVEAPAVRATLPEPGRTGWLVKDAHGQGGWHVRRAASDGPAVLPEHHYAQQEVPGLAMSATYLANGSDAIVLGFNEMIVRATGARPFVHAGTIGPVDLPASAARRIVRAVRVLAREFELRGLGSVDFMLDGERTWVLEVNPRPSASIAHHARRPLVTAHLEACRDGVLPDWPLVPAPAVEGSEIVVAPHDCTLGDAVARQLADDPRVHDVSCAGTRFAAGDPVCSIEARGASAADVRTGLDAARKTIEKILETCP